MLSLIICSRHAAELAAVSQNVAATIGVPYEVVAIDNSTNQYGICEAYNLGAKRARYELLCFMHEDIRYQTAGWGSIVAGVLADKAIGVLGVAGSTCQLPVPSAWWWSGEQHLRMNVRHSVPGQPSVLDYANPQQDALANVAVLDGLWLCCRKEVWQQFPFDQAVFSQFHFYDVDFCTRIYTTYRICVTFDILIEHFSVGSVNDMWLENAVKYQHKWQQKLPFGPATVAPPERKRIERDALFNFMQLLLDSRLSQSVKARYLLKLFSYQPITRDYFWMLKKLLGFAAV